jgi:carbon monoxide dehydrogenase subunit G
VAKFPTEVERSVTVRVPRARAYAYLWDVAGSSGCIPGLDACKRVGKDTYCFQYQEKSAGPVSLSVRYTAKYEGNGSDEITFEGTGAKDDNTEVRGRIRLSAAGPDSTRITLRQMVAPDTPIPRLVQGLIKSMVEREAAAAVRDYLAAVKRVLEETA